MYQVEVFKFLLLHLLRVFGNRVHERTLFCGINISSQLVDIQVLSTSKLRTLVINSRSMLSICNVFPSTIEFQKIK